MIIIKSLVFLSTFVMCQFDPNDISMSGSFGSVTIDNQVYNQISFRPEIPIGNLGIGLDLYFYIDGEGNFYKENWDFSNAKAGYRTILDKIYYVRWGRPTDQVYVRAGALLHSTLGNGILVNAYSNAMEYPQIKRIGLDLKASASGIDFEYIQSDFKRIPGLMALRLSGEVMPKLSLGFSVATDRNQIAGLPDRDDDEYPDIFDHFPDDKNAYDEALINEEAWRNTWASSVDTANFPFEDWFSQLPLNHNSFNPDDNKNSDAISAFSFDLVYKLNSRINLYSQFAQLIGETENPSSDDNNLGMGIVPLGLQARFGPINLKAELRSNSRNFIFNYWDRSYDVTRVAYDYDNAKIITRESQLYRYGKMSGIYTEIYANIYSLLTIGMGYQDLTGEQWNDNLEDYIDDSNRSLNGSIDVNTSIIPRLKMAKLFYMQNNVENPFDFDKTPSTVYGYDLSFKINSNMILLYKSRTTFVDFGNGIESVNSAQFETQILFN